MLFRCEETHCSRPRAAPPTRISHELFSVCTMYAFHIGYVRSWSTSSQITTTSTTFFRNPPLHTIDRLLVYLVVVSIFLIPPVLTYDPWWYKYHRSEPIFLINGADVAAVMLVPLGGSWRRRFLREQKCPWSEPSLLPPLPKTTTTKYNNSNLILLKTKSSHYRLDVTVVATAAVLLPVQFHPPRN